MPGTNASADLRVLVTGGAGFIGSHLVDSLLSEGHEVTVVDDLSLGSRRNLAHTGSSVEFVEGSVLDDGLVDQLVGAADLVFHLAAVVGVKNILDDPLHALRVNSRGAEVVLEAAHRHDKKVVLASTSEVNGKSDRLPMHENDDRTLGPTSVPRWGYATAKALDEHFAFAYAEQGLKVVALRYFNSYGPRMDPRGYGSVIATFLNQAIAGEPLTIYGDGSQTRCFTYVEDTARATNLAGTTTGADGQVVNVGTTHQITVADLAALVLEISGSTAGVVHVDPRTRFGPDFEDTPRRQPDNNRARQLLRWEPHKELAVGLEETLKWWRDNNA